MQPRRREEREGNAKKKTGWRTRGTMAYTEFQHRGDSGLSDELETLASAVIGACIEVHATLRPGLPESVYRKALSHELTLRGIPHECEAPVPVYYKDRLVGQGRVDLLVARQLVVELKVVDALSEIHRAQCLAYLCALQLELALLINFNVVVLKNAIKRVIRSEARFD